MQTETIDPTEPTQYEHRMLSVPYAQWKQITDEHKHMVIWSPLYFLFWIAAMAVAAVSIGAWSVERAKRIELERAKPSAAVQADK